VLAAAPHYLIPLLPAASQALFLLPARARQVSRVQLLRVLDIRFDVPAFPADPRAQVGRMRALEDERLRMLEDLHAQPDHVAGPVDDLHVGDDFLRLTFGAGIHCFNPFPASLVHMDFIREQLTLLLLSGRKAKLFGPL
jgi:hypothetical protein